MSVNSLLPDFRLGFQLIAGAKSFALLGAACLALAGITFLAAQFSPRQPATVALDVGISVIRFLVPVVSLFLLQVLLSDEIERKTILLSLTYPRSRTRYVQERFLVTVVAALAIQIALASVLALTDIAAMSFGQPMDTPVGLGRQFVAVMALSYVDFLAIISFGLLLAAIATVPNLVVVGGIGFMVIGRSASSIIALLEREQSLVRGGEYFRGGLQWARWLVPDLASLDARMISLYAKWEFLPAATWQNVFAVLAYAAVLVTVACLIFERRQFE